jgi:hypothetical protein
MIQISGVAKAADAESEYKINDPSTAGQREVEEFVLWARNANWSTWRETNTT